MHQSDAQPLLSARGIRKDYGDLKVLRGIDLDIRPGEILGLVGRNGVGKSTLAAVLAGVLRFDSGELDMAGGGWDRDHVMLINPEISLNQDDTVVRALFRHSKEELNIGQMMTAAQKLLAESGIALLPADRVGDLSGSEQRVIEVVRMLADPRPVIIIDELSSTLNAREVEDLRFAMERSVEAGHGILYAAHRLEEALSLCDRVAVMRDGHIVQTFDSATATADDLRQAMFAESIDLTPREAHVSDEVLFEIDGLLTEGNEPLSFTLHRGEILAICGARRSGVKTILAAFTGDQPCTATSVRMLGADISLTTRADLPRNRIAVLSSSTRPADDTQDAMNLWIGDDLNFDDSEFEATVNILKTLRFLEETGNRILKRVSSSTGQRRWLQLQELVAENARMMVLVEPMQGLDVLARERFIRMMEGAAERGAAVLLFSGDETEIMELADRALVIRGGALVEQLDREQITLERLKQISLDIDVADRDVTFASRSKRKRSQHSFA